MCFISWGLYWERKMRTFLVPLNFTVRQNLIATTYMKYICLCFGRLTSDSSQPGGTLTITLTVPIEKSNGVDFTAAFECIHFWVSKHAESCILKSFDFRLNLLQLGKLKQPMNENRTQGEALYTILYILSITLFIWSGQNSLCQA